MKIINVLISLIILTSQCVCVHSKVININSNDGNESTECCVDGDCMCSSLYTALLSITSNTIINITSKSVALHNTTTMGSGKLTNITITGSNVTIMCNNSGSVYCESCDHVRIEGITWDRCGDPNRTNIAGVTFNGTSNISLINCTFQYSLITAVYLFEVSDDIFIQYCNFLSNVPMYVGTLSIIRTSARFSNNSNITVKILKSYFYNNGYHQNVTDHTVVSSLNVDINRVVNCNVIMEKTTFLYNENAIGLSINAWSLVSIQLIEILVVNNSDFSDDNAAGIEFESNGSNDVIFSILSSNFNGNNGGDLYYSASANKISITINDLNFTDSPEVHSAIMTIVCDAETITEIKFYKVQFDNNIIRVPDIINGIIDDLFGAATIFIEAGDVEINMHMVKFTSNKYLTYSALSILPTDNNSNCNISLKECEFVSNISPGNGAVLSIYPFSVKDVYVQIEDTSFDQNIAGSSVVYITQGEYLVQENIQMHLHNSAFTNNIASSIYLSECDLILSGTILFKNNTAENGGAMYLDQGTGVTFDNGATVQFIANKATFNGGAIYVNLHCGAFWYTNWNYSSMFINNSAVIAGNSLYFNIRHLCLVNTNISKSDSILYVPCQFNYSQPVNGKMMTYIPCDLNYTLFNGTGAPIVTSPHELRLYFPYNEGYNISSPSKHNTYFVRHNILGQVRFTGAVFDYFGKLANPTQFSVQLQYSEHPAYSLISTDHDHVLTVSIDNTTDLIVSFKGKRIDTAYINLTLILTSLSYSLNKIINSTLVVELIPCVEHPGYTYSEDSQTCVCYHANVKCSNDGNEIKRGYWFGRVTGTTTTSLCPNHYCKFKYHKQTSEGYFELPNTINSQCNHHRVGRACGECISGYTLSYDSTDCISIDQCGPGWTVLVIVLTCLYWVVIVVGVFGLMYFKFQISLGYLYGIIYYYSMVGIMLGNNPYILDDAFQFISILSSFAQLTPQFLGKLCFVKGLSGIDQLFIHYSHAIAVSLLLLLIVVAARCSARMAFYVSRCIIRVICLLILLSYTSIAFTSLQLLRPLEFTDVKEWYTYSSPSIQYFHGRHAVYGAVAIVCELVVGIGLPLLLLLEPVLSRKINFIRIKPLLDQFQGCYKDKYRWFAAYYLICRQVIFLIVYNFNSNYYNMLFYLQTVCVIIAMIHMWFQPYQRMFLNALDGVMLLLILFEVNINTFPFLKNVTIEIVVIMVILPLLLISTVAIKNVSRVCLRKYRYRHYDSINDDDKVVARYVRSYNVH